LKTGASIYDFSSIIRIALNQYLNSNEIKEIIEDVKKNNSSELLYMAESSLSKDWLSDEEDDIWQNL
jgi:hypothetical protein